MKFKSSTPYFTYVTSNPNHPNNNCILADGEVVHRIENLGAFYHALGYTDDMQKLGIEPEFYRWTEFSKDNPIESELCLQSKIIEYLNVHSSVFRKNYGGTYESLTGACPPENLLETDRCKMCRMHPGDQERLY
jgi:hypothetical protein